MTQIDKQTARLNLAVIKVFYCDDDRVLLLWSKRGYWSTSGISECTKRSYHSLQNRTVKSALLWSDLAAWFSGLYVLLTKFYPDISKTHFVQILSRFNLIFEKKTGQNYIVLKKNTLSRFCLNFIQISWIKFG